MAARLLRPLCNHLILRKNVRHEKFKIQIRQIEKNKKVGRTRKKKKKGKTIRWRAPWRCLPYCQILVPAEVSQLIVCDRKWLCTINLDLLAIVGTACLSFRQRDESKTPLWVWVGGRLGVWVCVCVVHAPTFLDVVGFYFVVRTEGEECGWGVSDFILSFRFVPFRCLFHCYGIRPNNDTRRMVRSSSPVVTEWAWKICEKNNTKSKGININSIRCCTKAFAQHLK